MNVFWVLECRGKACPPKTGEAPPMYIARPPLRFCWKTENAQDYATKDLAEQAIKALKLTQFEPREFKS